MSPKKKGKAKGSKAQPTASDTSRGAAGKGIELPHWNRDVLQIC
jgi:hypothetical protein